MSSNTTAIRTATTMVGTVLLTSLVAPSATASVADRTEDVRAAAPRTQMTFTVDDCEGCEIQLTSALGTYAEADAGQVDIWSSKVRAVRNGSVTFDMLTKHTWGMSVAVRAPWEGHTGYRTTLAWRYNGTYVGDTVTLEEAVTKKKGAACWEGSRSREVTMPIVVEKVRVLGVKKEVAGSIAFVPTTQSWLHPMRATFDGVLGSQDVNICH